MPLWLTCNESDILTVYGLCKLFHSSLTVVNFDVNTSEGLCQNNRQKIKGKTSFLHWVRVMVFSATFNNISVISSRSDLLVEETGIPGDIHKKHNTT
jgi:hypothetical protein